MLSRINSVRFAKSVAGNFSRRAMHATPIRGASIIEDLYSQGIKAYKPRPIQESDEGTPLSWTAPKPPTIPNDDILAADVDLYEKAPIELEGATVTDSGVSNAASEIDWFPKESTEIEEAH